MTCSGRCFQPVPYFQISLVPVCRSRDDGKFGVPGVWGSIPCVLQSCLRPLRCTSFCTAYARVICRTRNWNRWSWRCNYFNACMSQVSRCRFLVLKYGAISILKGYVMILEVLLKSLRLINCFTLFFFNTFARMPIFHIVFLCPSISNVSHIGKRKLAFVVCVYFAYFILTKHAGTIYVFVYVPVLWGRAA